MAEVVLQSHGLTKRYGSFVAVDRLDLAVRQGEVFGLLGPNGSGKTTTILMLLGLTEPSAGSVQVLGLDPARQPLSVKTRVGYLPDQIGFYDGLTARENVRYIARLNGMAVGATPISGSILRWIRWGCAMLLPCAWVRSRAVCASGWGWPRYCSKSRS